MRSIFISAAVVASSFIGALAWDVEDIPEDTRIYWCEAQTAACPILCRDLGAASTENKCFPDNLYYVCQCTNGIQPNSTEVIQTIPYFTCTLDQGECVKNCGTNSQCAKECKEKHKCSATDPTLSNITATATTSPSASATAKTGTCNGFACAEGTDQKNSGAGSIAYTGAYSGAGLLALGIAAFIGL